MALAGPREPGTREPAVAEGTPDGARDATRDGAREGVGLGSARLPGTSARAGAGGRRAPRAPDWATILGLAAACGVILTALALGGSFRAFYDPPALVIVLGGTLAVTAISFTGPELAAVRRALGRTLFEPRRNPRVAARQMLLLADAARRTGLETLRSVQPELRGDPFLQRGVGLIADGLPPEEIHRVLTAETEAALTAQSRSAAVLRRAAEVAPAMGLIGTLIGLVQMLGTLDNPSAIGPAMAVALLTTFYGAVLGNMVLTPLAGKIEAVADQEALVRTLYTIGAVSIARQENPRRLELLLNTVLPPGSRIRFFDA